MTIIKRLVMKGFKSFANKTEMVFSNGYNCILGPNGSGKSNVLDAVCFVLGKGSSKAIRAEKSENLIYNGGKKLSPAKEGEVSIFFDNSQKEFSVDSNEVKITRKVRKGGQSIYMINDKRVTRQEILELLFQAKINPDGYNIILQGDITRFVEMSPVERRETIENVIGISEYEKKKAKAINELEKVDGKLSEAEIILTERRTYLNELKKERDEALKYKDVNDRKREYSAALLKLQINRKKSEIEKKEKDKDRLEREIKSIEEKLGKLREMAESYKKEIKEISEKIKSSGEGDQAKLHKEIEDLRVHIGTNKSRLASIEQELLKLDSRKTQLNNSLLEIDEKINKLHEEKNNLMIKKQQLEKEIKNVQEKLSELRKKQGLDEISSFEKEIEGIESEADELQKQVQELRERQQESMREKDKAEYQLSTINERMAKIRKISKDKSDALKGVKEKKVLFKHLALELSNAINKESEKASQLANAREKLFSIKEKLEKLKVKSASIKDSAGMNIAVRSIIENKSRFKGVYDTIANLGSVQSAYQLALETAAGQRVNAIVVENDRVAAQCISYLKKSRLGSATFLPLNKIKRKSIDISDEELKKEGVIGKALDLIKFDKRFLNAFSFVFGDTLVVDNIKSAVRMGIGRFRMCTLEGDITEKSGAMQGGFRHKKRGSFREGDVEEEIAELEEQVASYETLVSSLATEKEGLTLKIEELRKEKAEVEGEIIKTEKSLHIEDDDLTASKKVEEGLTKRVAELDSEISKISSDISEINKKLAGLKIRKQELRQSVNSMRDPSKLAELNTFEQRLDELRGELNRAEAQEKSIDTMIETILLPEKEKTVKILKQHEKEKKDFNEEIQSIRERIKLQEGKLKEKEKSEKALYSQFKDFFDKRDRINETLQKKEANIIREEEHIRSAEMRINALNLEIARLKAEVAGTEEEYKAYKDVVIKTKLGEDELKRSLKEMERKLAGLGAVNMRALDIYDKIEKEYASLMEKKKKLIEEKGEVVRMINEIETRKKEIFLQVFEVMNENFKRVFSNLTMKGKAFLILENPKQPFEGGVRIKAKFGSNKEMDIRSLSGGEKTLTALAFIYAIQEYDPASFYVFDEVDAALDKRNSEMLAKLVRKYSEKAQYIVISHNDALISEADNLYGVSMNADGISKVVSLKI